MTAFLSDVCPVHAGSFDDCGCCPLASDLEHKPLQRPSAACPGWVESRPCWVVYCRCGREGHLEPGKEIDW